MSSRSSAASPWTAVRPLDVPLRAVLIVSPDELVKEALAAELVPVIWWFFTVRRIRSVSAAP